MMFRQLGHSGLKLSLSGLGCNNLGGRIDAGRSQEVVHAALDCGINFFDVADVYGRREAHYGASEETLGKILGNHRQNVVIATKFGMPMDQEGLKQGASRRYIRQALEASLKRLNTDYIDLYQLHTPDPDTPIEETLSALNDLTREGKILYYGCSNFSAWQLTQAHYLGHQNHGQSFISIQNELSLLKRDALTELMPATRHLNIGFLPFFPLASGLLTGKYKIDQPIPENSRFHAWAHLKEDYFTSRNWEALNAFNHFATVHGRTLLSLAMNWLAHFPAVTSIIAGATSAEQVKMNTKVLDTPLTDDEIASLSLLIKDLPL